MTTHKAFPGLGILSTGDWLCTYRVSTAHAVVTGANRGIIYGKISSNDGATWGSAFVIADDGSADARDSTVQVLANGDVLVPYFTSSGAATESALIARSTDDGATWTDNISLTNTFTDWSAASGVGVQLGNGDVLQAYYGEDTGEAFSSIRLSKSTDNGATWSAVTEIADGPSVSRAYGEPNLVLKGNGDVVCYMRTDPANVFYTSTSTDSGATWSTPTTTGISGTARPTVYRRSDGLMVWMFRTTAGGASIMYSEDDGVSWTTTKPTFGIASSDLFVYSQLIEVGADAFAIAWAIEATGATNASVYLDHIIRDGIARP